jgi:hypothetical protein
MLSHAVLVAVASAAQAIYVAGASTCQCFPYHTVPQFKPGTSWLTFTELDESDEMVSSGGAVPLRGNSNQYPDIILARYRLQGANPTTAASNTEALALTVQMRADKMLFPTIFKVQANLALSGLALEAGKRLHIVHSRGGPYDVLNAIRSEFSWECTITCRAGPK